MYILINFTNFHKIFFYQSKKQINKPKHNIIQLTYSDKHFRSQRNLHVREKLKNDTALYIRSEFPREFPSFAWHFYSTLTTGTFWYIRHTCAVCLWIFNNNRLSKNSAEMRRKRPTRPPPGARPRTSSVQLKEKSWNGTE